MNHFYRIIPLISIWLFLAAPCFAERSVINQKYDAKTSVQVDHMFDEKVKSGFHPYRVTIRNGKARPITWTIRFDTNSSSYKYNSTFQVRVEPGAEVIEEFMVPTPPTKGQRHSGYRRVDINASAPGLNSISRSINGSFDDRWPSIIMSKKLASRNLNRLATKRREDKRGQEYFASTFRDLPSSWKGLTCVDVLMLDDSSWRSLSKQQKRAVMTWVRFGGRFDLFTSKEDSTFTSLGIDNPDSINKKKGIFSLGSIEILTWNDKDLPDSLLNRYDKIHQFDDGYNKDFGKSWELMSVFGTKSFNPWLVFVLLIIFAILVGPVNLFHFAKAGQRHRLFITTPIISLIASLVIMFIILVQDGIGGNGTRIAFIDMQSDPDQRQMQIIQHQISRTGVMFRSGFKNKEIPGVTPVNIPASRWNPLSNGRGRNSNYQFNRTEFNGDLFRSRSEQGFHLRSVRSTRSRIERRETATKATKPKLFSSMEFPLADFFYIDTVGVVWKSPGETIVNPGQEIALKKSNLTELQTWLKSASETMGNSERSRVRAMKNHRQRYFATITNPGPLMIETHSAIRWKDDAAIVSGTTVEP